jgi:hypothetical protein
MNASLRPLRPYKATRRARIGVLPLCLGAFFAAGSAYAQTPSPEDMAAARSLGTSGVQLADKGDCVTAIPKLDAAEKLFHAPTTLERLGECEIKVGHLVAGTEHLNRVVREPLPPNAPPAFLAARQRAQGALGPALPRIGKLHIHVDGVAVDKVTVTVDGEAVPSVLFDSDRPTDPGPHEVKAVAPGFLTATSSVSLQDGASASVSLKLDPDPNAVAPPAPASVTVAGGAAAPAPPTSGAPPAPGSASGGGGKVLAITSFVVGGVGVVAGSIFGVMALSTKSSLDSVCGSNKMTCPGSSQSNINSLGTNATISTVGFGVGIVGVALGVIFLATSHGSEGGAASAGVRPWLGIGSAGLEGRFE